MLSHIIWDDFPRHVNIGVNLLTYEAFKALFMESISVIFKPPSFLSPINVLFFTLWGLLSHVKSNKVLVTFLSKSSGSDRTEAL